MPTPIAAFLLALSAALLLTPVAIRLANRLGAIDQAGNARKIHGRPVPRLGGLAIVGAFYLALAALALADQALAALLLEDPAHTGALLAGGLVVAALGFHDDRRGASATLKLAVELGVAAALWAAGHRIDAIALPLLEPIALGWLSFPVTLLWIAGVTNAVNLIDGLDGLAAGVASVAAIATALLALLVGNPLVVILAAALAGGALGFLRFNFNPASVFMGDTGSLFLGFVLAATSLGTHQGSSTAAGLLASALVLGLPIADTTLAICRRTARGLSPFHADREHIHHRLLDSRLGHRGAVLALYGASLVLALAAVALSLGNEAAHGAVLLAVAVAAPVSLWWVGALPVPGFAQRRRSLRPAPGGQDRVPAGVPVGRVRLRRAEVRLVPTTAEGREAGRMA